MAEGKGTGRRLIEALEDACVLLDADGRVVEWNGRAAALYRIPRSEAVGRCLTELIGTEPNAFPWPALQAGAVERARCTVESTQVAVDGGRVPVELTLASLEPSDDDHGVRFLLTVRDVSGRKAMERALRELRDLYRMVVEQSLMSVVLIDENGRVLEFNRASEELTGLKREQVLGQPYVEVLQSMVVDDARSPGTHGVRSARIAEALRSGKPAFEGVGEYRYRLRSGKVGWVEQLVYSVPTEAGYRFGAIAHDVTERKRLAEQVLQRTKMEALGRLAGGIAHDFNNLLTGITGNLSLALPDIPEASVLHPLLADAVHSAESAASLTRQLLAFSRMQEISPQVVDLNALILASERMLGRLLGEGVHLSTSLAPGLGAVKVDPGQFEQVLVNLALNARDAMPAGGTVAIETANEELDDGFCRTHPGVRPGPYVMIVVSDDGHGMSPEVQAHLFEPFFTTKPPGGGTGLGLSSIYGTVSQAGGIVDVESKPDCGTTFRVRLPAVATTPTREAVKASREEPVGGTETILLVEDEPLVRDAGRRILERLGYTVLCASSGAEALQVSAHHPGVIDLLLTDVVMPGMNGWELAERLSKSRPGMRVLFASGHSSDVMGQQGLNDEGCPIVAKPYTMRALATTVRALLDVGSSAKSTP